MSEYERQHRYERRQAAKAADIGELPPIADPGRRKRCIEDLLAFLTTYFPASTGLSPFSDDHMRVIGRIQQCILDGGLFINAVYRGFAKTTISENAALWAVLYGHRLYVPIFGADASSAAGNIDSIKTELAENDLLYADFPEVCHAIRALEGKPQRCASQTYQGKLTHIEWTADQIVLPTLPDSVASGAILSARGIEGCSRGMKHKRPDGTQQRPDFVIIDDPQTDKSAGTALQVRKRLNLIRKSILKLGGHNRKMACVVNATVIEPDDLVDQLLNPSLFPAWQGERIPMVRKWAGGRPYGAKDWKGADAHERLWLGEYARLRNTYDADVLGDQQRAHQAATAFYRANRAEMDVGCEVSWEHCYDHDTEISAIQHAYNLFIDDGPDVFASECQNCPIREEVGDADALTAEQIRAKVNNRTRGAVPASVSRIVAFIDVQKTLLPWLVCGFEENFTGYALDYGTFPEQKRTYFARKDAQKTLAKLLGTDTLEATIYAGLDRLVGDLTHREWKREDGVILPLERVLVDANWGDSTDTVYQFCRQSAFSAVLLPTHGRFVGAKSKRLNEAAPKPGERRNKGGPEWRIPSVSGRHANRYGLFDANGWKTFVHSRLRAPLGAPGCLSLFGSEPDAHRLLADHLTAEIPKRVSYAGREVTEWDWKPGRPDNDWFDCLVGCHVAASMQGVTLLEAKPIVKKKVSVKELQKKARRWDAREKKWVTQT